MTPPQRLSSQPGFKRQQSLTNFQKDDSQNLLRGSFKLPTVGSDTNLSHNPRTSMSQLRLFQLGQDKDDGLERFGLLELRDGFFDPIYTKPVNVSQSLNITDDCKKHKDSLLFWLTGSTVQGWLKNLDFVRRNYLKNWIILSKFTLAFLISLVICVIDKSGHWMGRYRVFLPISALVNHPVHSVGTQFEITVQSVIGLSIGLGWSSLALYISTATQPTRNHQGGILSGSLFLGILVMGWLKAYYIRFYYILLSSGFVLIFMSSCLKLDEPVVHWKNAWNIVIPYLFGLLVSLIVSVLYFPYVGGEKLMTSLFEVTGSIKSLLTKFTTMNSTSDEEEITHLQKEMINKSLLFSETFREFLSGVKLSYYDDKDLTEVRNHLNFIISPLRVIPSHTGMYYREAVHKADDSPNDTQIPSSNVLSPYMSGATTPLPKPSSNIPNNQPRFSKEFCIRLMNDAFNAPLFKLLSQMIDNINAIEATFKTVARVEKLNKDKKTVLEDLEHSKLVLKKRIYQLDHAYRKFSRSDYFSRDLLNEQSVTNIFLFLRYSRQAAVLLMGLSDLIATKSQSVKNRRKLYWPSYPLKRAIRRLPNQCLKDQGADSVFHYFETKLDVDDAFERIYNLNTSRIKNADKPSPKQETNDQPHQFKTIRAIDHNDFNFHSTSNKFRYKLWRFSKLIHESQSKYALKVSTAVVFLSLPAWLKESWSWYYTYHCYWAPILVYYFLSPRNSGTWDNLLTRTLCWFIGCFWGWSANQARHFQNSFVIAAFAVLICLPFSYGFLVATHPRSSIVTLLSFTIISVTCFVEGDNSSASIFKNTWITSVAVYISVITSIFTNWLVWPFVAKHEVYSSTASLLSHIAQSYQSVSERYLYRDVDDDPTDLTLELAHIREVRMSQSLLAIRELLQKAKHEHDIRKAFSSKTFETLLDSCDHILEKIIEARMSGVYFRVWEQDKDGATTEALASLRRDSVATVIYVLYILSNSIRTKSKLPKYFPSAISVRKRLFDIISELEVSRLDRKTESIFEQLNNRLTEIGTNQEVDKDDKSYLKIHWTEVHGMAFSSAFTSITEELENLILITKELLGEESIMD